ncbi:MAG: 5-(carboxyamino)imidazole ribonucleotide synthase [Myxococcaceae bacterium]|nr:MAG: 5-(carboxyamino)imidazole ribonucleotide synthase [Myxococcaceae bacterium]
MSVILPGATIGILGGGQLGRMTAMAARSLGYHLAALDPDPSCAARFLVETCVTAAFDDVQAARDLAQRCQVATVEIEKISIEVMRAIQEIIPMRPGPGVLHVVQDRARQKDWVAERGFPVGPYRKASTEDELREAAQALGGRCYVKATRGGYDGRGQDILTGPEDTGRVWSFLGGVPVVVEKGLELDSELSVLVARRPSGEARTYAPALNHHVKGILEWSVLPGPLPHAVANQAESIARDIAAALGVEGLLVAEFFLTRAGELYVNELAPRPHNTFHSTEVACATSQFEQHTRSVCDLPLGSTELIRPAAIINLLGDLWVDDAVPPFDRALEIPGVQVHLYGKRVAQPGRKMGHLSAIGATPEEALQKVQEARGRLNRAP